MRPGRVKESVLKRSVLRQLHTKKPSGSPAHGEVSVISTEGWTLAAQRTVYGAVNHLAAAGAAPESVALTILMPEHTEEPRLKELTRQIDACCVQTGIYCAAVYAAASPCVKDLVISATGIGLSGKAEPASAPQRFRGSRLPAGLDLVAVGSVGREGTAMLACEREEALLTRYPSFFIAEAKQMSVAQMTEKMQAILGYVTMNIPETDIWSMITEIPEILDYEFETSRVPYDDLYSVIYVDKQDMLVPDREPTLERLQETIYG